MYERDRIKRIRRLTMWCLLSVMLNVALLSSFVYRTLHKEQLPGPGVISVKESIHCCLERFEGYAFDELCNKLLDVRYIEQGYRIRDCALSILVSCHDVDIERALADYPFEKRLVTLGNQNVLLFPGLEESAFGAILQFLQKERLPFTAKGLFARLQTGVTPELFKAFCLTKEWSGVKSLFRANGVSLNDKMLLSLLFEFAWHDIISAKSRYDLLMMRPDSKFAMAVLLQFDQEHVLKTFSDAEICSLFTLFQEDVEVLYPSLQALSCSMRSSRVTEEALRLIETARMEGVAFE